MGMTPNDSLYQFFAGGSELRTQAIVAAACRTLKADFEHSRLEERR